MKLYLQSILKLLIDNLPYDLSKVLLCLLVGHVLSLVNDVYYNFVSRTTGDWLWFWYYLKHIQDGHHIKTKNQLTITTHIHLTFLKENKTSTLSVCKLL